MKAWIRDFLKSRTARITGMLVVGNVVILLASAWVISVLTTDYQALADKFDEQRAQDLVDTVVEQVLWTEHQGIVDSVVSEVVQSGGLREAFDADQAALEAALEDEFGRQAISGGAISPIGLTAYDADLEALTTVWHEDSYSLPSDLVEAAREREGRERMQAFTTVWSDGSQPILTVMRPVGSFSVEGYVAFHVDPVPVLAGLDSLIRQSLVVTDSKGDTVLAEGAGFDLPEGATVRRSDLTVSDPEGNVIAHLEGRQDVTEITGALANARGDALELFLLVGGGTALAVTFGLGFIVRRSEVHERAIEASAREAEEREAQLRAEREEADRRSKREQEELRRKDILGLAGELDTEVVATIHETRASALEMITKAGSMAETADVAVQDASRVRERCEEATGEISGAASACEELQSSVQEIVRQIGDATNATQSASNEARDANGRVDRLGEAASNINDVVKLIQDIAEQTNLLALNATIEAARAGEAGKGFAVVAGEVKGLATKTAEATGSIAERVRQIQEETDATVAVIGRIAQAVGDVEERLSSVSSATEQQTSATGSIARTVAAVDTMARNVVEEISGTVERVNQTSNSSSDLKGTLEQLTRQIEGAHKQALNVVEGLRSRAHDTHADAVAQDGSADQPSSEKDGKAA